MKKYLDSSNEEIIKLAGAVTLFAVSFIFGYNAEKNRMIQEEEKKREEEKYRIIAFVMMAIAISFFILAFFIGRY